jgi:hypothetical protein
MAQANTRGIGSTTFTLRRPGSACGLVIATARGLPPPAHVPGSTSLSGDRFILSSTRLPRHGLRFAVFLPIALLAAACSDAASGTTGTGGAAGSTSSTGGSTNGTGGAGTGGSTSSTGGSGTGGDMGTPDTTAPAVVFTDPVDGALGQSVNLAVSVGFSEAMDPLTITAKSFTLTQSDGGVAVTGTVSYAGTTAIFLPSSALALGTSYVASVSTAATDLAGNALVKPELWKFTTDAQAAIGPAPVVLGAAGSYVVLAKSAISNVPTSKITGDLALSPAPASYITGFSLTKAGTHWTTPEVIGSVFAADNDPPTPVDLTTAVGAMMTAYTDAAGRPTPGFLELGAGTIGGLTLAPGLYKWTSTVTIPADITLSGAANDTWIFQVAGDLDLAAAKSMKLIGGARAKNIVWQVSGNVTLGTTSHAEGIVMSKTAITLGTGASINGRLFAQTAVSLDSSTVTKP